ncbi:MAG: hypothetical protein IPJ65_21130 [Archangiaceae bacterium]|nr:hypothetical protein [Archangiaceae bacterium]
MRHLSGLALLLSWSALAAAPAVLTADGTAVVVGGDRAAALKKATQVGEVSALAEALKRAGGSPDDAQELYDAHRSELITSSQVGKDTLDGNILSVKVSASVDLSALKKLSGASGAAAKAPASGLGGKRVLILATEQLGPREIVAWSDYAFSIGPGSASAQAKTRLMQLVDESGSLEAAISNAFSEAGFEVIDLKVLKGKLEKPGVEAVDLTAGQAQAIANKSDADLVVIARGKADLMYHPVVAESGMHSGSGNVVARAIRVRDGKVLSSSTQAAARVHLDVQTARILALNEAAKLASAELLRKLNAD